MESNPVGTKLYHDICNQLSLVARIIKPIDIKFQSNFIAIFIRGVATLAATLSCVLIYAFDYLYYHVVLIVV